MKISCARSTLVGELETAVFIAERPPYNGRMVTVAANHGRNVGIPRGKIAEKAILIPHL